MASERGAGASSSEPTLTHERVDDVPLIVGLAQQLGLAQVINRHVGTHGRQRGLSVGQLTVGWLAFVLSQADHRKSAVRAWANGLSHTLSKLFEQPVREVEFSDDRLGTVLRRLSRDQAWAQVEHELWAASVAVYQLEAPAVRLDSTTSLGYHQVQPGGLMQRGHSKDHRPDLPQLKLMAAAAQPGGQLLGCDVVPGQRADDQLYTPLVQRVRAIVGRTGVLYAGDSKMAALATRAEIAAHGDYYLVPLPTKHLTEAQRSSWVQAAVEGRQPLTEVWQGDRLLGHGYEFERPLETLVAGQPVTWSERVQVFHSLSLAERQGEALERRLTAATAALQRLTPPPGPGRRQLREPDALARATAGLLARHEVVGLLTVHHECQPSGRGDRYVITGVERDELALAARVARLGWCIQATNAPADQLPLPQAVRDYRAGWSLERDFHLIKDLPLGLSPLFVWRDEQIIGLTRLLTLALRLLTLVELLVRRRLTRDRREVVGLYEGQPARAANRPTGRRILRAFAASQLTLTRIKVGVATFWHLTALTPLLEDLLADLGLSTALYTALATPQPSPT